MRNVETEGQEVVALVRRVALSVQQETNGGQRPELSLAVPFEFYFKPGPPQPPPTVQQLLPAPSRTRSARSNPSSTPSSAPPASRIACNCGAS